MVYDSEWSHGVSARHIHVRLIPWSDFVQSDWRLDGRACTVGCGVEG